MEVVVAVEVSITAGRVVVRVKFSHGPRIVVRVKFSQGPRPPHWETLWRLAGVVRFKWGTNGVKLAFGEELVDAVVMFTVASLTEHSVSGIQAY